MIVFDDMKVDEKLMVYDKGVRVLSGCEFEWDDYVIETREGDVWSPYVKQQDALLNSIEHFSQAIANDRQSITDASQAIRIQKILEKADLEMLK